MGGERWELGHERGGSSWDRFPLGGVLDLDTRTWRALPERPEGPVRLGSMPQSFESIAVGDRVVSSDGLLIDPRAGSWEAIPESDAFGREGASVVWTGSELIVWGGVTWDEGGGAGLRADGVAGR